VKDSDDFGHVKLSRKLFESDQFWLEERQFSRFEAWVDVIQLAAWKPSTYRTAKGVVRLQRGEFLAARRHLAKRWNWTEKKVRVWLEFMQNDGRIRTSQGPTLGPSEVVEDQSDAVEDAIAGGHEGADTGANSGANSGARIGNVYLIVNYDAYQNPQYGKGPDKGQRKGQTKGQHVPAKRAFQGPKIESKKHKDITTSDSDSADIEARTGASDQLGLVVDPPSDVQVVLDHYVAVHPKRRPGEKERKTVERALRSYSPAELCEAIDGNAQDDWHRGIGKHELTYVLRDNSKIDDMRARLEAANGVVVVGENGLLNEAGLALLNGNGRHS
jgi:hypothetical protein